MTKEELIKLSRENLRKSKQGSLCECYDEAFIKGYELSKKRIAELKADNVEWEKASDKWKSVYEITNNQLTKAKELLAKWVELFKPKVGNIPPTPIQVDTEQFLKSEVEK